MTHHKIYAPIDHVVGVCDGIAISCSLQVTAEVGGSDPTPIVLGGGWGGHHLTMEQAMELLARVSRAVADVQRGSDLGEEQADA